MSVTDSLPNQASSPPSCRPIVFSLSSFSLSFVVLFLVLIRPATPSIVGAKVACSLFRCKLRFLSPPVLTLSLTPSAYFFPSLASSPASDFPPTRLTLCSSVSQPPGRFNHPCLSPTPVSLPYHSFSPQIPPSRRIGSIPPHLVLSLFPPTAHSGASQDSRIVTFFLFHPP